MKTNNLFAILLTLSLCPTSGATEANSYSAKQLIEMAISRNPGLQALNLEVESADHLAAQSSRWSNPNLEIAGAEKSEREGESRFIRFGISQFIERPGRIRHRRLAARARAETSVLERKNSELETRALVLKLIYSYSVAKEKANHAKERLDRFKTISTYLKLRVFASPQKGAEAAIVGTKLMVLGKELRELEANRRIAWNTLNRFLGMDAEPIVNAQWFKSAPELNLDTLMEQLNAANPSLQKQNKRLVEAESEVSLARSQAWPGMTLTGTFENGTGANPEKIYGLGLSFPLPVFDSNSSGIRSQQNLFEAARARREGIYAAAKENLRSALERYHSTRISLTELAIGIIGKLEKDMVAIDRSFKRGQVDLLTYIEADAEHTEGIDAILDTQIDFVDAQNDLYLLVGQSPRILE